MRVAIQKLPGVDSVDVSLNEGLATILFEESNRLSPERIREVIRSNGFSPKSAELRAAGRLVERDGHPALQLPGQDQFYRLVDPAGLVARADAGETDVLVEGRLPEADDKDVPVTRLELRRLVFKG